MSKPRRRVVHDAPLLEGSPAMDAIRALIADVADTDAAVLIRGETGVGKDLVARAIHAASLRDQGQQTPEPSIRYRQFVAGLFQNFVERPFMLGRFKKSAHCILYIGARFFLSLATA